MITVHRSGLSIALTVLVVFPAVAQSAAAPAATVIESRLAAESTAMSRAMRAVDFGVPLEQLPQPAGPPPTPRHTGFKAMLKALGGDVKNLPSMTNLYWAVGGGALSLGVHQVDDRVRRQVVGNETADNILKPGRIIGNSATLIGASVATYAFGRLRDQPKVSHVGMDLLRSLAMTQVMVRPLKYSTRRERPDQSDKTSFPSGHAADTFAVATVLERHVGWRYSIPGYLFASYIAASRLPSNRHWLSDVTFGATIGVIAGRTVTRRVAPLPVAPVSVPGGMALMYRKTW